MNSYMLMPDLPVSGLDDEYVNPLATVAALTALLGEPSPRERYRQVSREAAKLERDKQYRAARRGWLAAASLAPLSAERAWCEARSLWCERMLPHSGCLGSTS